MKRLVIPFLFVLILSGCRSYTIADGRANIVLPKNTSMVSTKFIEKQELTVEEETKSVLNASLLVITMEKNASDFSEALMEIDELEPDIILLTGDYENQKRMRSYFTNVYELEGASIILSERLENTTSIPLYVDDFSSLLAETDFLY